MATALPESVEQTQALLARESYVADRALATTLYLSLRLGRPLFLEGEAGVGKTEVAKVLARGLGRRLIRLQCYEGLDVASAVYEWSYSRQMLELRLSEAAGEHDHDRLEEHIFSERFLLKRPILQALETPPEGPPILLIDELDRTDEPFEAFLLEVLSDFQVTVPELGTFQPDAPPHVIITSNRTREIHDALKRRCLYHWVDFPDVERELEILRVRAPEAAESLARQVVADVQKLRASDLFQVPGVAESIDWTAALLALDKTDLDPETLDSTLGVVLKYQDDIRRVRREHRDELLADARAAGEGEA